jgi:peptidoglycan/LPS O-acetylase OafA/YrhL
MTGIRGVAAVWVMMLHAGQDAGRLYRLPWLERISFFVNGWHGVDLFFMLSGFILMYAHGQDFVQIRTAPLVRFARLRFTRVYPLNAAVLLLISVLVWLQPGFVAWMRTIHSPADFSLGAFVRTLFLATRWFLPGRGDWNEPVWSLSLEILGYLAFPFLAYWALRVKHKWAHVAIALGSLAGAVLILKASHDHDSAFSQIAVVRMFACFLTGIAIFRLWTLAPEAHRKAAPWMASAAVACILITGQTYRGTVLMNFFFAVLLYALAFQQGIVSRLLSSRAAVFLGEISFPLYLIHVIPIFWLRYYLMTQGAPYTTLQRSAMLLAWLVGCFLMATLLHYFVEKPAHALGRRWAGARVSQ